MKLGSKDNWYTKPRQGRLFRTSNFILHDPLAFNLVFQWGLWFSCLVFGVLCVAFLLAKVDLILPILFGIFFIVNIRNLIKFYKFKKASGDFELTISQFMQYRTAKKIKTEKVK